MQWRLLLASTFNADSKNCLVIAIVTIHAATAYSGIKKTMKALTDKFESQSFSSVMREYVWRCNSCYWMKYLQTGTIRYLTPSHVSVRPWSDITMDCLKLSLIFTKCSLFQPNIAAGKNHIAYILRLWMIVDNQSWFKCLVPVPNNFNAEQCTATFDTHVVPTIGYSYCIVFHRDTLFMSRHLQSWAASKGIKLEPSTAYQPQTCGQLEIVN